MNDDVNVTSVYTSMAETAGESNGQVDIYNSTNENDAFFVKSTIDNYFGGFSNSAFYDYAKFFSFLILIIFFLKVISIFFGTNK